jgi:hypothetical protein
LDIDPDHLVLTPLTVFAPRRVLAGIVYEIDRKPYVMARVHEFYWTPVRARTRSLKQMSPVEGHLIHPVFRKQEESIVTDGHSDLVYPHRHFTNRRPGITYGLRQVNPLSRPDYKPTLASGQHRDREQTDLVHRDTGWKTGHRRVLGKHDHFQPLGASRP